MKGPLGGKVFDSIDSRADFIFFVRCNGERCLDVHRYQKLRRVAGGELVCLHLDELSYSDGQHHHDKGVNVFQVSDKV
jgi:hypothetical protein